MFKNEHHDIVVIGTGFAGLGMAIALKQAGVEDLLVLERAGSVGGTWRDNTYPGCACDVPTPLYSFSFAPNPDWSYFYARHHELRAYLEACTDRYGVRPHIRFGADARAAAWEEEGQRWRIRLGDGGELTARILIGGLGGLNQPSFPDIEGLDDFAGPVIHSAAWDHDVALDGKRIAVIGTGASSIQLIPRVARVAAHVDVYQRTAPWVFPKLDRRFSRVEKALFRRLPFTQRLLRAGVFVFSEGIEFPLIHRPRLTRGLEAVGRALLRIQVRDPELRAKLRPRYRAGCKRMLVASDYYPALTREHVDVITEPIARITATGIVTADGAEHAADVLVCGTGFSIEEAFRRIDVRGRGGRTLAGEWADGIEAHRGTMVAGFPNLMFLSGPNTGTGSTSQVFMIESQIHYVMETLRAMREADAAVVEVRAEAHRAYNEWIQGRMAGTVWLTGGCNSWYLDDHGRNPVLFPDYSMRFRRSLRRFRAEEHVLEPAPLQAPGPAPAIAQEN